MEMLPCDSDPGPDPGSLQVPCDLRSAYRVALLLKFKTLLGKTGLILSAPHVGLLLSFVVVYDVSFALRIPS